MCWLGSVRTFELDGVSGVPVVRTSKVGTTKLPSDSLIGVLDSGTIVSVRAVVVFGFGFRLSVNRNAKTSVMMFCASGDKRCGRKKADDAAANVRLRSGLRNCRQRRQGDPIIKDIRTSGAVRLDQNLELGSRGCARPRDLEIDLHQYRGAPDTHRRYRGVDFIPPCFAVTPATNEMVPCTRLNGERAVRPVRLVDHLVEDHPCIGRKPKHGAVDEGNSPARNSIRLEQRRLFRRYRRCSK